MTTTADDFIRRSKQWSAEMAAAHGVLLNSGLTAAIKWGKPCYSHDGNNIAILQPMKQFLSLMFFKGVLLTDPHGVLEAQGPNSRSALRMTFTSVGAVEELAATIKEYVAEAVDLEAAGVVVPPAHALVLVAELQERIDIDSEFKAAFEALTPGRQREYHLHIADAKQASTRVSRVNACAPRVLAGKGLRDR